MRYCIGTPGSARPIPPAYALAPAGSKPGNHDPVSEFASFSGRCDEIAAKPFSPQSDASLAKTALLKELDVKIDMLERRLSAGPALAPSLEFVISDAIRSLVQAKQVRDELKGSGEAPADGAARPAQPDKKPELSLLILNISLHRLDDFSASGDKDG